MLLFFFLLVFSQNHGYTKQIKNVSQKDNVVIITDNNNNNKKISVKGYGIKYHISNDSHSSLIIVCMNLAPCIKGKKINTWVRRKITQNIPFLDKLILNQNKKDFRVS